MLRRLPLPTLHQLLHDAALLALDVLVGLHVTSRRASEGHISATLASL